MAFESKNLEHPHQYPFQIETMNKNHIQLLGFFRLWFGRGPKVHDGSWLDLHLFGFNSVELHEGLGKGLLQCNDVHHFQGFCVWSLSLKSIYIYRYTMRGRERERERIKTKLTNNEIPTNLACGYGSMVSWLELNCGLL